MKIIRTITMEADIWAEAKTKTDNISGTIQLLLKEWVKGAGERQDLKKQEELEAELVKKTAEMAKMKDKLEEIEKEKEKNKTVRIIYGGKDAHKNKFSRP